MQSKKFKQLQQEIKCLKDINSIDILKKFEQYANLSNDKLAVFEYMEKQKICVQLRQFWLIFSNIYFEIRDYQNSLKAIQICKSLRNDVSISQDQIQQAQDNIIFQLVKAIKQNVTSQYNKSLLLYEALKELSSQKYNKKNSKFKFSQKKKKLQTILEAYNNSFFSKEYIQHKISLQSQKNKNKFKPFMPTKQREIKKSTIKQDLNINALSPKNIFNKGFRTKTQDSIQLVKKRKKNNVKINKQSVVYDDDEQQQINYNTTSMIEMRKRVHFVLNSQKKFGSQTDNKKIERFRSLNLPNDIKNNYDMSKEQNKKQEINK